MLSSAVQFVVAVLCIAAFSVLYVYGGVMTAVDYFKTREGLGVLKGIVLFILFALCLVIAKSCMAGEFFAFGDVFLGLDNTNHISPMCKEGEYSSRLTSNGGVVVNIYQSSDEMFHLNTKYTHHSCAFNPDDKSYDAIGIEAKYRLWGK